MIRSRFALSAVIATVILAAVSVAIAISASYWMSGISGQYAGIETIEIPSAYCELNSSVMNARWVIVLTLKNSGSTSTSIIYVMVNEDLADDYEISPGESLTTATSIGTSIPTGGIVLQSGESVTVYVWVGSGLFSSGTSVSIEFHSVSGFNYAKLMTLA